MSSKVKPTGNTTEAVPRLALPLVAAGTALVLITYVSPLASITDTSAALGAGGGARAWLMSSMSMGLGAALLASGAIGDRVGRRRVYLAGLLVLAVGAVGCAVAPGSPTFIAARVVEGIGGAAVLACGLALLASAFPLGPRRAHATAVWGASVGGGLTLGVLLVATVGGSWRTSYVVVAVLAVVLVAAGGQLPDPAPGSTRHLDLTGLLLLSASMTALVAGLTQSRAGLGPLAVGLVLTGAVLLAGFAAVERRVTDPLIEPALLRSPGFAAATVGSLAVGLGIIAMASNAAGVIQQGLGESLRAATLPLLVWSVTSVVASLVLRRVSIPLSGPALISLSLVVVGVGQLLGLGLSIGSSAWRLAPAFFVAGLATGVLNAVLGRESVASVPSPRAAMGSGANNTARYLGAACGITVFSVLVTHGGTGSDPVTLISGWNHAVLVSTALTLAGALVVAVIARVGLRR